MKNNTFSRCNQNG